MQLAAATLTIFTILSVMAACIATAVVLVIIRTAVRQLLTPARTWLPHRAVLYLDIVYLCLLLLALSELGAWLLQLTGPVQRAQGSGAASYGLIVLLALQSGAVRGLAARFEISLVSGRKLFPNRFFALFAKLNLAIALGLWLTLLFVLITRGGYWVSLAQALVTAAGLSLIIVSILVVINDRWVDHHLSLQRGGQRTRLRRVL